MLAYHVLIIKRWFSERIEKNTIGEYFIYLINGEKYQIDLSHARLVESYFERG